METQNIEPYWQVGDVVHNTWGYGQTNVDWYQVTRVSASSVWIRAIDQNSSDHHGSPTGGMCQPIRNSFKGREIRKVIRKGSEYLKFDYGAGSKWNGKPKFTSSYN